MNYIAEINSFYDWLELNQISSNAINLWHALMATANKARWENRFTVAISVLEIKTGLQRRTLERARNELTQKGRIGWKKRSGNQSAEYEIFSLCDKNNTQFDAQVVVQPVAQVDVQVVDINKLNKTKQEREEKKISLMDGSSRIVSKSLFTTLNKILEDQIYIERLCMNNSLGSIENAHNLLKLFFVELENRNDTVKAVKDAKDHFAKWLVIQLEKKGFNHGATEHNRVALHPDLQ